MFVSASAPGVSVAMWFPAHTNILRLFPISIKRIAPITTVYPKKYAHGFVVLCFVVVMQSFIMNSHEVFIHIHQGCFAGTGAIVRLPQCQWSKPDGYEKISQCITTTKHSKAKTVCIFLGIYCTTDITDADLIILEISLNENDTRQKVSCDKVFFQGWIPKGKIALYLRTPRELFWYHSC